MKNKLLLYVHFNRNNELSEHVIYQIQKLRQNFEEIFFISNSKIDQKDLTQLTAPKLIDGFMQRENAGYDFAAWSDAMKQYGFDKLANYDSVTIMNDTCFGPVYDFTTPFERMDSDNQIDFWGITNNRSHKVKPWEDKDAIVLPDHIQSYFVSYKQNVVKSVAFEKFWSNIEVLNDVVEVIIKYETAMTKYFENAGFKSAVLFDTRKEDWTGMVVHDFSVFNLPELLKREIAFLKIKAFSYGAEYPTTPLVVEQIKADAHYPVSLIIDHMSLIDYPNREYMLVEKFLSFTDKSISKTKLSIGIHLHVTSLKLAADYLDYLDKYVQSYDLYITTDSEAKKKLIEENYPLKQIKSVIVTGKGVTSSWLDIYSSLQAYDLCGHFTAEQSETSNWLIENSYQREVKYALLKPAQAIFREFEKNSKLGLIMTDSLTFYRNFDSYNDELTIQERWEKMIQLGHSINVPMGNDLGLPSSDIRRYGTMVWYRPQALENLVEIDTKEESDLRTIEQIILYISWSNGFDFRISRNPNNNKIIVNEESKGLNQQNNQVDFDQIRLRKLVKELLHKMKTILFYRFKLKK